MSDLPVLSAPDSPVLLHTCCAPCSGELIQTLIHSKVPFSLFFYNPNIHPRHEYERRKQENLDYAEKYNIKFYDMDYDTDAWFERAKGLEMAPERGERCTKCFDMRFERTALFAYENGYPVITSSLGLSRWKDMNQINGCGVRAAESYSGIEYWTYNWRKQGGAERMYQIAKAENMYQQEYCGCVYSLRDTNLWRKKNDRPLIRFDSYYEEAEKK